MHNRAILCGLSLLFGTVAVADDAAPLADAAEHTNHKAIQDLLDKKADVNATQSDGMTALHWAAYRDDLDTAKLIINASPDAGTGGGAATGGCGAAPSGPLAALSVLAVLGWLLAGQRRRAQ